MCWWLIAVEILSSEDRLSNMEQKAAEYHRFGIEHSWIVDPEARLVYRYTQAGLEKVQSGELIVPGTPIRVDLAEMFAELNRA